jgi:Carboxypeptidase regulatory-like domain
MFLGSVHRLHTLFLVAILFLCRVAAAVSGTSLNGVLTDAAGKSVSGAVIALHATTNGRKYSATTADGGQFDFRDLAPGSYDISVTIAAKEWKSIAPVLVTEAAVVTTALQLSDSGNELRILYSNAAASAQASGGGHLSSTEVSSLPLNVRDFSKLLLLAAGTMTDANGAANFTQQFAVNGQRGVETVFSMDGHDTTDAEMGGATFSNFNVDAIQEVQSSSGVMPAEIGHGAAGYTNVVTKSGVDEIHGSVFEFARNAAFDARNYFDDDVANGRRIPPFVRNEFGFTNGGPVVIPHIYDGHARTFYFGEYQGFRQVLATTEDLPVPTANERNGIDTTTYPGDTLTVPLPLNTGVSQILNGYPLPNDPGGPFGDRTYATASKVYTRTDQFSIRIDHQISSKSALTTRFSLNQVTGPLTNPDQTAINPTFGVLFYDHQRNAGVTYTRTISPHLVSQTSIGYIRSTPFFPAANHTQPGILYADGLYQAYNQPAGSIFGAYGNLLQLKQDLTFTRGTHGFKWGVEIRVNRDSTIFGTNPNGLYVFGGGTAYSPELITSASGTHDIQPGDPLPDSLTQLLTGSPYSYAITAAANVTPIGDKFDEAGVRREAYNFYFEDAWKATPHLTVSYGLRYEVNSRIHEATKRTSLPVFTGANGQPASYLDRSATQQVLINPQPPYDQDWDGWGPRLSLDYGLTKRTMLHAGGAIVTLIPNLWQDNFLTAAMPYVFAPYISAEPGNPVPFQNAFVPVTLPAAYNIQGQPIFPNGRTQDVPANTILDLPRFQSDLEAITPGHQVQLLTVTGIAKNFANGDVVSWTAGVDHNFGDVKASASYVATVGIHLPRVYWPNSYGGASPAFAPFTQFNAAGQATGGFAQESLISSGSHSTYNALQTSLTKNSARAGLGLQGSYTYSKSIDDTSAVLGGLFGTAGTILQTVPQNPWNPSAEKALSTFDVKHVFTVSVIELLPLDRVGFLHPVSKTLTKGWQVLNITTLTTGSPFGVYSGIQQTGAGNGGADRPDLVSMPHFSTSHAVRDDYFGQGVNNASFFNIPINVPGGTGPNDGRFGTLNRDTFRGPAFHNLDFAMIKDTPFGHRGNAEFGNLEFRAEFFDLFNIVNFSLPSNIVRGSGFGIISKTASNSRQIQFSLKIIY